MTETRGVLAAAASSALGGAAVAATRYLADGIDPLALGSFRFGIGFLLLLPVAYARGARWPARADWLATVTLGLLFFALFPVLFNLSLRFTTASRGALALSTLPLLTMAVAAAFGVEPLSPRKTMGVFLAVGGVAMALLTGLQFAPAGAWRGDLLMVGAALTMACYSVWSRPVIRRSDPITFTAAAMGVGAACLVLASGWNGGYAPVAGFGQPQWLAIGYLGLFGGAIGFLLWGYALAHTTPTRVSVAVTVNPIVAGIVGAAVLDEPLRWNLLIGLLAVLIGIWIAMSSAAPARNSA